MVAATRSITGSTSPIKAPSKVQNASVNQPIPLVNLVPAASEQVGRPKLKAPAEPALSNPDSGIGSIHPLAQPAGQPIEAANKVPQAAPQPNPATAPAVKVAEKKPRVVRIYGLEGGTKEVILPPNE